MISPTQRSLKMLRSQGWHCEITEHWNPHAHIRQDLWGFCDILCLPEDGMDLGAGMLAVQTTTLSNMGKRVNKIKAHENYPLVRRFVSVQVHGWRKLKTGWECKVVEL